jgi:arylsulfatase
MERLQAAGYSTGAVGKMHMFPPKGFHEAHLTNGKGARWRVPYGSPLGPSQLGDEYAGWLEARHPGGYALIYEQRRSESYRRSRGIVANVLPTEEYIDTWTTENAMQFIARERDTPFFLWYGFCNPHGPIDPPQEYAELYRPEDMELTERYLRRATPERGPSEEHVRRFLAHYYGLCTYVDDMLAKVFSLLKEKGLWDNTLIIFTADHGEMAGDHGRFSKGNFYEPVIRVPLIIKPPAGNTYLPVVSDMVETIDIAPTILDYAKLPIPETVQGISLRSVMEGRTRGKEAILCEFTPNDQSSNGKCIRSERYKYEYWAPNGPAKLFDLQEDPHELRNVIDDPAYATVRIEMQQRLTHHLALSEKPILYP